MNSSQSVIKLFAGLINRPATAGIEHTRLFSVAVLVSFLGSLPPGTTNLMTVRLSAEAGVAAAVMFSIGCLLAELVTVSASLVLVDRVMRFKNIGYVMQWISLIILLLFTVACFMAATSERLPNPILAVDGASPLVLGFVMMIINPVQLPFWLGWTALLAEKKFIKAISTQYLMYVSGSGAGSLLASVCFIFLGKFFVSKWTISPAAFYSTLGVLFLLTFLLQLRKVVETTPGAKL